MPKNGTSDAETKKGDLFLMPTSPQNGGLHVCFMRLALLGGFQADFQKLLILIVWTQNTLHFFILSY